MKATYIELLNRFWAENRRCPFSPCQSALYFFLLNEANAIRWEMPVAVPTAVVCQLTGMGKSSLMRAREALQERGMISFTLGTPRRTAPQYTIADTNCDTKRETNVGTNDGANDGTIIKDIDKEIYSYHNAREKRKIEELEKLLMTDLEWQDSVIKAIDSDSIAKRADVQERLRLFFNSERAKGVKEKEEKDCRSHFFNWVKKSTAKKKTDYAYANQRRVSDITAQSPEDYQGRF